MQKPSEIIKEKIEEMGGSLRSRQVKAILEFLDEEYLNSHKTLLGLVRTNEYCIWCGQKVKSTDFKDPLSMREYKISGLCQLCQDKTFKE